MADPQIQNDAKAEAPPALAVDARGLAKTYGGRRPMEALKGIDLQIPRGAMFGLLGPNGAGKSTFINILAGLVVKSAGEVRVWGYDIERQMRRARSAIGVVPQEVNIDAFFTPRELLEFQAGLYGVPAAERRTDEILAAVHLTAQADAPSRSLSGGMRRRVLMAKAMVHDPPVLVLDEPTAGVDVELRQQLWDHIRGLNRAGVTVVLTTHYLEEAQQLCDSIAIIHHGEVVACDSTERLLARLDRKELTILLAEDLAAVPPGLDRFEVDLHPPRRLSIHYRPSQMGIEEILAAVRAAGLSIADLTTEEGDLEDIFLALTR
ncbi:MAG: ABC transporter ATP-binding protein [Alphaproteobacteria bacterium]|jgi:ABC-2 type transport system ATP-binding protein|nr:ABC transporter ATP-binding protein [Alphaproteobacteria bacterium]MDP6815781.1 ABC transporter ATP-binding protein [Alphaproteobacteria bacterium]